MAAFGVVGCSSDCRVACEKFEECGILVGSLDDCIDQCEDANDDEVADCANCLDDNSCGNILNNGSCDNACSITRETSSGLFTPAE